MKLSVVLLDWSVRESFHAVDYLNQQKDVNRSDYEVIWVEYFDRNEPTLVAQHERGKLDKHIILGTISEFYQKHIGWNEGVVASNGDIVVLCDSDAMFPDNFIRSIIDFFDSHDDAFLHLDEIRNNNKALWPFSYPSWDEVMQMPGLWNWDAQHHVTTGLSPDIEKFSYAEKIFLKNYGACQCIRREDYIKHGGLDEHETYNGFICGPYDLTFRLTNAGLKEHWHNSVFLMHTYHPWTRPEIDHYGPHVRHMSTTSLKHRIDGTIMPIVENKKISVLRKKQFPEPAREGMPCVSIIVPNARSEVVQRLQDSVARAVHSNYEIILLGDKSVLPVKNKHTLILESDASTKNQIKLAGSVAQSNNLIIISPNSLFRPNAIDVLLLDDHFVDDIRRLSSLVTYTNGYVWSLDQFIEEDARYWSMALIKQKLDEFLSQPDRYIVEQAASRHVNTIDHNEHHWNHSVDVWCQYQVANKVYDTVLLSMLKLETKFRDDQPELSDEVAAEQLLLKLVELAAEAPNEFFEHYLGSRYNLLDLYRFIGIFREKGKKAMAKQGYRLFTDVFPKVWQALDVTLGSKSYLENQDSGDHNEYFIGVSSFQLAVYAIEENDIETARRLLDDCLMYVPSHKKANELLSQLTQTKAMMV
ncbi:MAG: glycosyltransferase [Gammaproteobacteria bacterium]|nr:glycosyltransferase [Gammaproteobacteria bacterium]